LHRGVIGDERLAIVIRYGRPKILLVLANDLFAPAGRALGLSRHWSRSLLCAIAARQG